MNKPFFRRVADEMLDHETARQITEQEEAIARILTGRKATTTSHNCYACSKSL